MRTAAARKRRYRARQRAGVVVVSVAVTPAMIEALVDVGWIELNRREDRAAIADGLARQLDWWLARFGQDATERL